MTEQEYTIVEPHVEFFEPPDSSSYLQFLERCTRTCYKSEKKICPGSAEKLMSKVVKEYEHYSVTEHANCILQISPLALHEYVSLIKANPLFAFRHSLRNDTRSTLMSGNVRMWMELIQRTNIYSDMLWGHLQTALHQKWPFFFEKAFEPDDSWISLVDENPISNKDNLTQAEMEKHMTLTFKFVGDRSMSHQLVRHRLFAFSQESQRYCHYGKKGFQFIIPPGAKETHQEGFIKGAMEGYRNYLDALDWLPPEDARGLLPNCTKTEVVTTGTIAYWKYFFHHRGHNPKAQWQIRQLALDTENICKEKLPGVFDG